MAEHGALWQWIIEALSAQRPVALLVVVDSHGSSPGKMGAKMAVTAESSIGTIGGGAVEYGLVKTARAMLVNADFRPQILRRIHQPAASAQSSGMICGGEQTVLVYPCRTEDRIAFEQLRDSCRSRMPIGLSISAQGLQILPHPASVASAMFSGGEHWRYQEALGLRKRAYIIGGGYVGLALSRVLDWLDFDITVIDERDQLQSMQVNDYAWQKWLISYGNMAEHLPEGSDVFVFIMTHSHHTDALLTARLAKKQFAYLGLLGSSHKIAQLKAALADQLTVEQLQQIHAPMGLPIKSHSPAEIAISIAAEIIQLINANQR